MVRKLMKYDILNFVRKLLPIQIALLLVACMTRFIQFFEADTTAYNITIVSSGIILGVFILVCMIMTVWFGITRFYKNLFTSEGYLSFTLPVTPAQHIFSKLVTFIIFNAITVVVSILAVCIATAGDVCTEIFKALAYLLDMYNDTLGTDGTFYIIEALIFIFVATVNSMLVFYACISIGQLAKKSRAGMAFVAYLVYYFISQAVGTVFTIIFSALANTSFMEKIVEFLEKYPHESVHIFFGGAICLELILGVVYFFISLIIIRRKLNLE